VNDRCGTKLDVCNDLWELRVFEEKYLLRTRSLVLTRLSIVLALPVDNSPVLSKNGFLKIKFT
jgi:hypothetical protein